MQLNAAQQLMAFRPTLNLLLWRSLTTLCLICSALFGQENRITRAIDSSRMAVIGGNVHPEAQVQFDKGAVEPSFPLNDITLLLKKSPSQEADLERLLEQQQEPSSSMYHHWLTPEQYADRFGASRNDIEKMSEWLRSNGLTVIQVARGRDFIISSGTAQQVETALHTSIHLYDVDGAIHYSNAAEPSVPEAFADMVAGFWGLNDFHPKPLSRVNPETVHRLTRDSSHPYYSSQSGNHFLAPDDLATIYSLGPLYQSGFDGRGQSIVIAGQTDINVGDIDLFRKTFNLPPNKPIKVLVPGSPDPGVLADEVVEADLDLEWSGAIARNATIFFVYSQNAFSSVNYAVDIALAPVISFSFGACESHVTQALAQTIQQIGRKASVEGITWVASSGDSGAAGCEDQNGQKSTAVTGLNVPLPASVPEVTAVGGTEFSEGSGTYWSSTNDVNGGSALSYIPEISWNDSSQIRTGFAASGGGASEFFAKPTWQNGPGVPTDGRRDVPDIALTASDGHDPYLIATGGKFAATGGTSAAAPSFAGMLVLLNQYLVAAGVEWFPGLGNINPSLYWLSKTTTGVFHDVTTGSNMVPCEIGSADCYNGVLGYIAGPGYDQVTGLGSVNAYHLIVNWAAAFGPSRLPGTPITSTH
jgi:subtilase family serine protease